MGAKSWGTVSEYTLRQRAAAWMWLERVASGDKGACSLDSALLSKAMVGGLIVERGRDFWLSCGNYAWAALFMGVEREDAADGVIFTLPRSGAVAEIIHATSVNLSQWASHPWEYFCCGSYFGFRQVGEPEPLLKAFL